MFVYLTVFIEKYEISMQIFSDNFFAKINTNIWQISHTYLHSCRCETTDPTVFVKSSRNNQIQAFLNTYMRVYTIRTTSKYIQLHNEQFGLHFRVESRFN